MKKILAISLLSFAAFSAQAKDIVDTAVSAGNFKTLATALTAAGLISTLKGPGPFTVFAPTDEAFAKIPKAQLDALLADKAKLTSVLTYHVVAGKVMAKDVKAGKVKTVQGSELTVSTTGGVMVDNAKVTATDIVADNGVIHVIDTVLMPKYAGMFRYPGGPARAGPDPVPVVCRAMGRLEQLALAIRRSAGTALGACSGWQATFS